MLNLLHFSIQTKGQISIIVMGFAFAIFFSFKTYLTEQKLKKLEIAKEKIHVDNKVHNTESNKKTVKYSVFYNSIQLDLNAEIVENYELLFGKLTDFAIEKRIDAYEINKDFTNEEISQKFEEKLNEEIENELKKG